MSDDGDVQLQLTSLQEEEARIMRELREIDEQEYAGSNDNRRKQQHDEIRTDPMQAMSNLLLECEKEVRDAKGYIADHGPLLRIKRVRPGEPSPRNATYLARPKNTGVDFTVPVTSKTYTDCIKNPIFLNQIRDKVRTLKYSSVSMYIDDMRLLVRNTATFTKDPDLQWVVQHSQLLLASAQDSVASRKEKFDEVENSLRAAGLYNKPPGSINHHPGGKRKRSQGSTSDHANGDIKGLPPVGATIDIYWTSYRKWFLAYIIDRGEGANVRVRYDDDNSEQNLSLTDHSFKWRIHQSRTTTPTTGGKGKKTVEPPPNKRRKQQQQQQQQAPPAHVDNASAAPAAPTAGVSSEEIDSLKTEFASKFDELSTSVTNSVTEHYNRVNAMVLRSDAMQRVLIAIGDMKTEIQTSLKAMTRRFDALEKKVDQSNAQIKQMKLKGRNDNFQNIDVMEIDCEDVGQASTRNRRSNRKIPSRQAEISEPEIVEMEKSSTGRKKLISKKKVPENQKTVKDDSGKDDDKIEKGNDQKAETTQEEDKEMIDVDLSNTKEGTTEADSSKEPKPVGVATESKDTPKKASKTTEAPKEKEKPADGSLDISLNRKNPTEKGTENKSSGGTNVEAERENSIEENKSKEDKPGDKNEPKSDKDTQQPSEQNTTEDKLSHEKGEKDAGVSSQPQPGNDVLHPIKTTPDSGSKKIDKVDTGDDLDKDRTTSDTQKEPEKSNKEKVATKKPDVAGDLKNDDGTTTDGKEEKKEDNGKSEEKAKVKPDSDKPSGIKHKIITEEKLESVKEKEPKEPAKTLEKVSPPSSNGVKSSEEKQDENKSNAQVKETSEKASEKENKAETAQEKSEEKDKGKEKETKTT